MSSGFVELMTEIAKRQMHSAMPTDIIDGVVLTPPPGLTISLGGTNMVLDGDQLMVSEHLLPHDMEITSYMTDLGYRTFDNDPLRPIQLQGTLMRTRTLQPGESVAMLRFASGQKYFVFARGISYGSDV